MQNSNKYNNAERIHSLRIFIYEGYIDSNFNLDIAILFFN